MKNPVLTHYFEWHEASRSSWNSIMQEFCDNDVRQLVLTDPLLKECLRDQNLFSGLKLQLRQHQMQFTDAHLPYGQAWDLCCMDKGRRSDMLADQKRALAYASDFGCRTATIHIGAYDSVYFNTPNEVIRPQVVGSLEILLEYAQSLGIVLAIENSYEKSNSITELLYYLEALEFHPNLGVCFDAGHAWTTTAFPGRDQNLYHPHLKKAWDNCVLCFDDPMGMLYPHIVTAHIHDNNGYGDDHALPGTGSVDFQLSRLLQAPRLLSWQSEVKVLGSGISIRKLAETFRQMENDAIKSTLK